MAQMLFVRVYLQEMQVYNHILVLVLLGDSQQRKHWLYMYVLHVHVHVGWLSLQTLVKLGM